jgi:cytochrome P450
MLTTSEPAGVPVAELATWLPLRRWQEALRAAGTHQQREDWIVSGRDAVAAALTSATLRVAPPPDRRGPAAELLARMARFSNGAEHERRRRLLVQLMPPAAELAPAVAASAREYLARQPAEFDLMPLARSLPAEVLAAAMGLPPDEAVRAASLTGLLCDGVTPRLPARQGSADEGEQAGLLDADGAADGLLALLAAAGLADGGSDELAAAASILFQARDATAGLIGLAVLANTVLSDTVLPDTVLTPAEQVERVLRQDAPVQNTRRIAAAETPVGTAVLPAGAPVWIFVATAECGDPVPATFGTGPHGCPGAAQATMIAREVVTVLESQGWRPVAGQQVDWEPRPNVRVPRRLMVARP